jgi:hypothetical protein
VLLTVPRDVSPEIFDKVPVAHFDAHNWLYIFHCDRFDGQVISRFLIKYRL